MRHNKLVIVMVIVIVLRRKTSFVKPYFLLGDDADTGEN